MWRGLDWNRRRLSVVRTLEETKQGLLLKAPKTARSARIVPLPDVALDALRQHQILLKAKRLRAGASDQDNDLVFPDDLGCIGCLQSPRYVTTVYLGLVKRAGLPGISIHSLRHTHITELLRAGVRLKVVSERAGHSSVAFTLQRYGHCLPDMQQDAADQTQKLVGGLVRK